MKTQTKFILPYSKAVDLISLNLTTYIDIYLEFNVSKWNIKNRLKESVIVPSNKKNWIVVLKIEKNPKYSYIYPEVKDTIERSNLRDQYNSILFKFYLEELEKNIKKINETENYTIEIQ